MGRLARRVVVWPAVVVAVLLAGATVWAGSASAQYGPSPTIQLSSNTSTGTPCSSFTLTIHGPDGDTYTVVFGTTQLGTITTDSTGTGSGTFTVPCAADPGSYVITATDPKGNQSSIGFVVEAATSTPTSQPLAFTGTNSESLTAIGAIAVGAGCLLVLSVRRSRRRGWRGASPR